MRSLLLIVLLAFSGTICAQPFSAGARMGVGYWMSARASGYALQTMNGRHLTVEPELFIRWTKKSWAVEGGVSTSGLSYMNDNSLYYPGVDPLVIETRVRNWELPLSVQYELRCPCMKSCPILKRVHNYIGVTFVPTVSTVKSAYMEEYGGGLPQMATNTYVQLWTGLNHTVVVDVTKKLKVVASGYVRIAPGEYFSSFRAEVGSPDALAKAGANIGLAYGL